MKINFFSFDRYLFEILIITNFLKWVNKTKKYNKILCLSFILLYFSAEWISVIFQMHDAMIDTYYSFELKQTQKIQIAKILLAYNIERDRNYT